MLEHVFFLDQTWVKSGYQQGQGMGSLPVLNVGILQAGVGMQSADTSGFPRRGNFFHAVDKGSNADVFGYLCLWYFKVIQKGRSPLTELESPTAFKLITASSYLMLWRNPGTACTNIPVWRITEVPGERMPSLINGWLHKPRYLVAWGPEHRRTLLFVQ